jgi:hypothetical protein|tara:strand:- start:7777 stop:8277 length:501 start_codon:yes stop_codon:yes gene_type:complete
MSPLLTLPFLKYFNNLKNINKTYLEIGSGKSTIYFSHKFKKVISFENNIEYFNKINKIKPSNVDLILFNKDNIDDLLKKELNKKPDYIMVDNDPKYIKRVDIVKLVHTNKKNDCIVILDNGTWNKEAYSFLKENYYCMDFPGLNTKLQNTVTSIFFTETNSKYIYM